MGGVLRPIALAAGLVLALAAPAVAAPNWTSPVSLSTPGALAGNAPSVAIGDGGIGVEAWSEMVAGVSVIRAAQHTPGGSWSAFAGNLSSSLPGHACTPFTSIDPAGNALVVWTQWSGTSCFDGMQTLLFATHAAGASAWSPPGAVGATANPGSAITTAAVNSSGQMIVAWGTSDTSYTYVVAAIGSPTGGFGAAPNLVKAPSTDSLYYLAAGIGPSGDAAVQWEHYVSGGTGNIEISVRPRAGAFPATPVPLTTNTAPDSASNGSVALDAAGDVLAAYTQNVGSVSSNVTQRLPAGNTTPQPPQAVGTGTDWTAVGFDSAGNATAVGLSENYVPTPHQGSLSVATRAAGVGSPWVGGGATAVLPGPYDPPRLLVNPSGAALVSWQIANSQNSVQAFYRPAGGSFGPLTPVGAGTNKAPALAPSGDAAIALIGASGDAQVAVLDTNAPTLASVSVPVRALPGAGVAMSASFSDAWTGLDAGQPVWSFGDGTTGSGAAVTHAYGAAGTYTVTLTAADVVGNVTAPVTRQIDVVNSIGGPPPSATLNTVTIAKPKVKAAWKASKLVGTVSSRERSAQTRRCPPRSAATARRRPPPRRRSR